MPSPFPGMDPYLEGSHWTSVHFALSGEITRQLALKLPERYVVLPAERRVTDAPDDVAVTPASIYPDGSVVEDTPTRSGREGQVATVIAPLQLATVMPERVPHVTIEIRDVANRELVTAIEVFSPVNKRGRGRRAYLRKRQRILLSSAHLLEIDLLREGQRVPMQQPLPPAPYFVLLSRAQKRPLTDVRPISFDQPLPTIPVPLLPPDPDVMLDLQLVFTTIYDLLRYGRVVDYAKPPEVPLGGNVAEWAAGRIQSMKG